MPVLEEIAAQVQARPDAVAYRCGEQPVTYRELWEYSSRLAFHIARWAGADASPVAVYGHKGAGQIASFLACLRTGHPYLPIDVSCPPLRIEKILQNSHASCLLAWEELPIPTAVPRSVLQDALHSPAAKPEEHWVSGRETAYIIYTSGSEGMPKGVCITAGSLLAFSRWAAQLSNGDVWLNQAPYSFDLSVMSLYPVLMSGKTVYDLPRIAGYPALFHQLSRSQLQVWVSTPSFAEFCLADPGFDRHLLPCLQTFLFCGETLRSATAKKLLARFPHVRLINSYGPTETTVAVTAAVITEADCSGVLPVGRPKPGTQIGIADSEGNPLPDGSSGEIVITGNTVAGGYMGGIQPEKFRPFQGRPAYWTGDIGRMENGMLWFEGRRDQQVKLRGYRLETGEIEQLLLRLDGVFQAAVLPERRNGQVRQLTACLGCTHPFEPAWLREYLKKWLPDYMVPSRFLCMDTLPVNANGKLDLPALAALAHAAASRPEPEPNA